ncbi:MAG: LysM peptidoglycan-binding domain-containing protein [Firmicutes bacterium]|nr:LysM peptidoglycan-binding domain-containing protein [Bacillota bacterium]
MSVSTNGLPPCPEGNYYTIRSGDTLFFIARRFNISVDDLIEANRGRVDPENLQVGQVICIPLAVPVPACPPGSITYVVARGDTFFSISKRFRVSVGALIQANPGVNPEALLIGQQICIPDVRRICPAGYFRYVIKSGDTFRNLAMRFNTTVEAIQAANPGADPYNLQIGQVICIPQPLHRSHPPGSTFYVVAPGDTCFFIARRFGTTVEVIIRLNPGIDPYRLFVGQRICIPTPLRLCPPGAFAYTIRPGDTFYNLALRFNTTVERIQMANPGVDPLNLQIGQRICIPLA